MKMLQFRYFAFSQEVPPGCLAAENETCLINSTLSCVYLNDHIYRMVKESNSNIQHCI